LFTFGQGSLICIWHDDGQHVTHRSNGYGGRTTRTTTTDIRPHSSRARHVRETRSPTHCTRHFYIPMRIRYPAATGICSPSIRCALRVLPPPCCCCCFAREGKNENEKENESLRLETRPY